MFVAPSRIHASWSLTWHDPSQAAEASSKRGRGRPKGSISKKKKASPKKAAAAGKKRGRKPKAAKEESEADEEVDE